MQGQHGDKAWPALAARGGSDDASPVRRALSVSVLAGLLVVGPSTGTAGAQAPVVAASEASFERALALALARPVDGPFVTRLVREARASAGGLAGLRARLTELAADPARRFAARCVEGHVARALREAPAARAAYEAARELRPTDAIPRLGLARLARDSGDLAGAQLAFAEAIERLTDDEERRTVALELGRVALAARDFEATERWFAVATRGRSRYERAELARAYADAGEADRAVTVLEGLAVASRGDAREEAPALRDLGLALAAARRTDEAIATLERARRVARGDTGLELEIDDAIVEAHRRGGRLDAYVDALAARRPRDVASVARIASLSEELGRDEDARAAFTRVVELVPTDPEPRARIVRLLLRAGRVDEALAAERALVETAPRAPRFFVPAIERLLGFGRVDEALALFDFVAARVGNEVATHVALADLAERLGDESRLHAQLEVLVRLEPGEPSHRIALATERLSRGERDDALRMLDEALREASSDPDDLATVSTALADRGFPRPAEEALRAGLVRHPDSLALLRAYADVLDPNGDRPSRRGDLTRTRDAIAVYERVLRHPQSGPTERRDARRRILGLERRSGRLDERSREWERTLSAGGEPALDAGHFLLELRQSSRPFDAVGVERVASRIVTLFPRDVEAYLALERARTVVGDHARAIEALERLVDLDPNHASAYVERLVMHAEAAYRDADALRYARLGVERSPTDPRAEARLGDLLRRRGDAEGAREAYRRALAIDDRRTEVWLAVAGLAIAERDVPAAVDAYDRVLRLATDDDSVGRAAEDAANALAALSRDDAVVSLLLPYVASRPRVVALQRALFVALERQVRLLERAGDEAALQELGRRGMPVLLESLADRDGERSARAARLLGRLEVASAFDALLGSAARHPVEIARRAALSAAAQLATPERAPEFHRLLDANERRTRLAAALVLVALGTSREDRLAFLAHADPWVRGAGVLASELADEPIEPGVLARLLTETADPTVRALASLAAGRHGDRFVETLVAQAARDELVGRGARLGLVRIGSPASQLALARVVVSGADRARDDAVRVVVGRPATERSREAFAAVGDLATATRMLFASEVAQPVAPTAVFLAALAEVVPDARATSRAVARLESSSPPGTWPDASALAERLRPSFTDADPGVRLEALRMFPRVFGTREPGLVEAALSDDDPRVVRAAIAAIAPESMPDLAPALSSLALSHPDFGIRSAAASRLVRAGSAEVIATLERVLRHDPIAFVREAAARSLVVLAPTSPALATARERDPEPRVRDAARIPGDQAIRSVDAKSGSRLRLRSRSGPVGDRSSNG